MDFSIYSLHSSNFRTEFLISLTATVSQRRGGVVCVVNAYLFDCVPVVVITNRPAVIGVQILAVAEIIIIY